MAIKVFHQCGHQTIWNRQSYEDDACGDGLILSPVHQKREWVEEELPSDIKNSSFFDPQYYLPSSQKAKLNTYGFFPENISGGFSTEDFSLFALKSAQQCVEFQIEQGFERIVIPTRYYDQMKTDFIDKQNAYTVHPFLRALDEIQTEKPVFLTLVLTSAMIGDSKYRTGLLNWVTSFPQIDGLYLIPDYPRDSKQIADENFLFELLVVVSDIHRIGLRVTVGYLNTEGVLLSLIPDVEITFGSFENTRIFSIDKFLENEEERRGPRARIYVPGLFNWLQISQAKEIRRDARDIWDRIHFPTEESERALDAAVDPTFNQPGLYKHHFKVYAQQINKQGSLSREDRYTKLRNDIRDALSYYRLLEQRNFDLERHGNADHLQPWLDAINRYWRRAA